MVKMQYGNNVASEDEKELAEGQRYFIENGFKILFKDVSGDKLNDVVRLNPPGLQ